ncbi:MAG: glycosyltransferase family 39 protein [Chloroflexota bacterium]
MLAIVPRAMALQQFVTADEAKWVYRSAQFMRAILLGDYAGTAVNLTPAVTTTWLGSFGLRVYYQQHQARLVMPFVDWLDTLAPFRTELGILESVRWPMVIFTSIAVVIIYLVARRLWSWQIAFLGAAFLALDPHLLSLSRIIGHDAPVAIFMTLSILTLFLTTASNAARSVNWLWLVISGVCTGLAWLSKSPALFLGPFAALYLWLSLNSVNPAISNNDRRSLGAFVSSRLRALSPTKTTLTRWFVAMLVWTLTAYLIFLALWPAVWVAPIQQPWAVVENAFLSATNLDEVAAGQAQEKDEFYSVPDWGPLYYVVNGAFKLSPLITIGLIFAIIWRTRKNTETDQSHQPLLWLAIFAVLFLIFMTLGGKRSNRYILPIFPSLIFLATYGWLQLTWHGKQLARAIPYTIGLVALSGLLLIPYAPYYFTYFNPLLGGAFTAPKLVKVGWGEGLDQVGRWLNSQDNPEALRVGSWYASTLTPFFSGDVAAVEADRLDYVVLYEKQLQAGQPASAIIEYFKAQEPVQVFNLAGIQYASIYAGAAAQLASDEAQANGIVAYRPHTAYAAIGQYLTVDVIWQADDSAKKSQKKLGLNWQGVSVGQTANGTLLQDDSLAAVRYTLQVPFDLPRGEVDLFADTVRLGTLPLQQTQPPNYFTPADIDFGNQIKLVGFAPKPNLAGDMLTVRLAFQAHPKAWADYVVYVHIINGNQDRLAGHDAAPNPPTSQWAKLEVILDTHTFPIPTDLSRDQELGIRIGLYKAESFEPLGEPYILPITLNLGRSDK